MTTTALSRPRLCAFSGTTALCAAMTGFLVAGFGCVQQEHVLVDPEGTGSQDGGGVQRASLVVEVVLSREDGDLAGALGLSGTLIPNASVTIERLSSAASRQSAITDAAGQAVFSRLLPGTYRVSALRTLTAEETALLGAANSDVNALGGGQLVSLAPPQTTARVDAFAGRRGSLVISEHFGPEPRLAGGGDYTYGQYLELYNNSDTTIFLDGKVLALGQVWHRDYSSPLSCAEMERWRNDPEGIWTRYMDAFPGSGNDHPLAPGRAVVIASDAIDHSVFVPSLIDLSAANFESIGSADVDNPNVPNMVNIGLGQYGAPVLNHGLLFRGILDAVIIVADILDVAALPRNNLPVRNPEYVRIPKDKILDVLATGSTPEIEASASINPLCPELVDAGFDRQHAALFDSQSLHGIQRLVLATGPQGYAVLLRTKTSARDFVARIPPTPGTVP